MPVATTTSVIGHRIIIIELIVEAPKKEAGCSFAEERGRQCRAIGGARRSEKVRAASAAMPTPRLQQVPAIPVWTGPLLHSPKCCSNAGDTTGTTLRCTVIIAHLSQPMRMDDAHRLRRKLCRTRSDRSSARRWYLHLVRVACAPRPLRRYPGGHLARPYIREEMRAVTEWEYRKIDLNQQRPRSDELDMLNAAGADGWELVGITSNNTAYLKRPIEEPARAPSESSRGVTRSASDGNTNGTDERRGGAHEVAPKYRDPTTNETWSGRGRMANWLKRKQEAGEDVDKYLV